MVAQYILAPDPLWSALTQAGVPAANGYVFTYVTNTRINSATYLDPAGINAQTNPVRLNSAGEAVIYWKVGDGIPLYTILVFADSGVDGIPGRLLASVNNYPSVAASGGGSIITVYSNNDNFTRNAQFTFWTHGDSFTTTDLIAGDTQIADAWFYRRDNTNSTVTIKRVYFEPQTSPPPGTAVSYLEYECTSAASSTVNAVLQKYDSVQTLANQEVTVGFWARTRDPSTVSTVSIYIEQYFGVGGSPTPAATLFSHTIDDTWSFYSTKFTVPPIAGMTIGTVGDDALIIGYQFQTNQIISIQLVDAQFQEGNGTGVNFPYLTVNDQYNNILQDVLQGYSSSEGTNIIGWDANLTLYEYITNLNQLSNSQEFLIGWNFPANPYQMGGNINSVINGTYVADQTIVVSDGNGVINKSGIQGSDLTLTVAIAGKKFGIFQIIESNMSNFINNSIVSLSVTVAVSSGTSTFKAALLGWNGALNAETRACVSSFNAPTVNPSLSAGWNYASTILTINANTTNNLLFKLNNILTSGFNSHGVLIWNDSADILVGQSAFFNQVSLRNSYIAGVNTLTNTGDVLRLCKRYFQRSYPYNVATQTNTPNNAFQCNIQSSVTSGIPAQNDPIFPQVVIGSGILVMRTSQSYGQVNFEVEMFKNPTMTYYSPLTSNIFIGQIFIETSNMTLISGSLSPSITLRSSNTQQAIFAFSASSLEYQANGSGGSINTPAILLVHYVADARLGV